MKQAVAGARTSEVSFGVLLAIGAAARLYEFFGPPDDAHEWRQTQTLMYAASYAHGAGLLTPLGNWNGVPARTAVLEFPIYSILAYWLSSVMDLVTSARVLSFLFSVAAIFVFDRLCAVLGHPRRRTATVLFAFAPVALFYGHAAQPDSLFLLLVVVAAYCAVRTNEGWPWVVAAALALAVAGTIKPTALVVLALPMAYLAWKRGQWFRQGLVLAVAAAATLGWAAYVRMVLLAQDPSWYQVSTAPSWVWGPASVRISPEFYSILLARLMVILLPPATAVFILVAARKRGGHPFWWLFGAGSVITTLTFATLNENHFYYQLPYIPGLAALAAYGAPQWPRRVAGRLAVGLALIAATLLASQALFGEQPVYVNAGNALAAVSRPGQPVVVMATHGAPWFPTVLYYAGRDGWNLPVGSGSDQIAALPGPAPCWLVIVRDEPGPVTVPAGWHETARTADYVLADNPGCGSAAPSP
ncbi:MAG: hypothetical protein ACHQ0J_08340 [Candidatus Dormibacterales bacterium]